MVLIGAGTFRFGPDNRLVDLPPFYIDVTPVTNADYSAFVAAAGHRTPVHWPEGMCPDDLRNHPVVNVTHQDAEAYCAWAGMALPTEEQWEKAARGEQGQVYPWGNQATVAKCNVHESGIGHTTPVERYHSGVSPYGVYDLSGNVSEWCSTDTGPGRHVLKGSALPARSAWPPQRPPMTRPLRCPTTTPASAVLFPLTSSMMPALPSCGRSISR